MYHHVKKMMYTVRVDDGANGELAAAMQYSVQGLNCETLPEKTY
jgi:Mn-containing catalase